MLSRILPVLSLVAACVLGWFLWSSGTLDDILSPKVSTPVASRDLVEGQPVRAGFVEMREVKASGVRPGMIAFPPDAAPGMVEEALAQQRVGKPIPKGRAILAEMMGRQARFVVLRTMDPIAGGERIDLGKTEAVELEGAPPPGVVVFDTESEALGYMSEAYDLSARTDIPRDRILTISDITGGGDRVFVIRASRRFEGGEALSGDALEVAVISASDMPRGAVAFAAAAQAEAFVAEAGGYVVAGRLDAGEHVTAGTIARDKGLRPLPDGEKPRTLAELMAYRSSHPGRTMIVDRARILGEDPGEGDRVDIWVEAGRTEGRFGTIALERLAGGVPLEAVYLNDTALARADRRDMGAAPEGAEKSIRGLPGAEDGAAPEPAATYWIELAPGAKRRFEGVADSDRAAFAVAAGEVLVDVLGNGASCLDGTCRVDRASSDDMAAIVSTLTPRASEGGNGELAVIGGNTLTILDGVDLVLAERLAEKGHDSLGKIAAWKDADLTALEYQLNISSDLARYLRRQARIITETSATARRDLGFEESSEE